MLLIELMVHRLRNVHNNGYKERIAFPYLGIP